MHVEPVHAAEAVAFVRRWHYAGTATPGVVRYGWFADDRDLDIGDYDIRQGVFGPSTSTTSGITNGW